MKQKLAGKTRTKATGPYKFLRYTSPLSLVAEIQTLAGKMIQSSVSNLLPLRPGIRPLQQWKATLSDRPGVNVEELWESDSQESVQVDRGEEME